MIPTVLLAAAVTLVSITTEAVPITGVRDLTKAVKDNADLDAKRHPAALAWALTLGPFDRRSKALEAYVGTIFEADRTLTEIQEAYEEAAEAAKIRDPIKVARILEEKVKPLNENLLKNYARMVKEREMVTENINSPKLTELVSLIEESAAGKEIIAKKLQNIVNAADVYTK